MTAPRTDWDAVVIGAGAGGGSAALHLARAGWKVAVVERKPFPRRKVCGEYISGTNRPALAALGLTGLFDAEAGPAVTRTAVFAGDDVVAAPLPEPAGGWGRALSRERLDTLLLKKAADAGATVFQPWAAVGLDRAGGRYAVRVKPQPDGDAVDLSAPVVVAAHGSWDAGSLPTQPPKTPAGPADLLGFKAHFRGGNLPRDLMPLLAFPGGYGGMAPIDGGRTSISLCVRRDRLERMRATHPGPAGEAVFAYLVGRLRGVREALGGGRLDGPWLAAGPIRPGLRRPAFGGVFRVGNAAGEAHPVVAEGVTMAIQAGALAAAHLTRWKAAGADPARLPEVAAAYAADWRAAFAPRIRFAAVLAHWAMSRPAVAAARPLIRAWPGFVTRAAALTGKVNHRYLDPHPVALAPTG